MSTYVFCNQCGHRNPPTSTFCSSCGSPLDSLDDRTITLAALDPLQDAQGKDDDVVVAVGELPNEIGVLIVRAGAQAGARFPLSETTTQLGRHPESEISLDDITVSRRHAEIERTPDGYVVSDAGSLNGTLPLDNTLPLEWNDIDKRCETIRGTPLDPRRLLPVVLIGRLRRQILSSKSRTIDLGHDVRLFPPALKNALLVEARGRCSTSACEAMYMWLVADHVRPHSLGGHTALANGGIRCTSENGSKGNDPSL